MLTPQQVFDHYDAESRKRELTLAESRALERAIKAIDSGLGSASRSTWTADMDEMLKHLRASGMSFADMSAVMGKSATACRRRLQRMEESKSPWGSKSVHRWTVHDDDEIIRMVSAGMAYEAIGVALGVSKKAVIARYRRIRQCDRLAA